MIYDYAFVKKPKKSHSIRIAEQNNLLSECWMTDQELQKLLDILKYVPEDRRDETTNAVLKAAADSISLEKIKSLTDIQDDTQQKSTDLSASNIRFSQKESNS